MVFMIRIGVHRAGVTSLEHAEERSAEAKVSADEPATERWRRAMTRRDRPTVGGLYSAPDPPDLPCSWTRRAASDDRVAFSRGAGEDYVVCAERTDEGVWNLYATQSVETESYRFVLGGAATRDRAVRRLIDCTERINAALDDVGLDGHVCLADVLGDVCSYETERLAHVVQ
jgi:hypothetical protein